MHYHADPGGKTMKRKYALIQMSMSEKYEENIAKVDHFLEEAAEKGANLVLIPELFQRHYFCQKENYDFFDFAEEANDSKTIRHYQEAAKRLHLVLPISFFEKDGNSYFNSLAMIDSDGKVLGVYRKSHIPTGECYEEKFYFSPGDTGFMVFQTSAGMIGIGICWDQWFPETARCLALQGAEILLFPTAIGSEPVLPHDSSSHWQNVMKGHAAANIMPVLAANRIGEEKAGDSSMTFYGRSFIANEHGETLQEFGRTEEGLLIAELDLEEIGKTRRNWGVFRDRRPDLYGSILHLSAKKK